MLINIKSEYDFMKSTCRISKIVEYAKENNLTEIGICDFSSTIASFKFHSSCIENNIKPIIGSEFIINQQSLHIYPKNKKGYYRLNEIITEYQKTNNITFSFEEDLIVIFGKGHVADSAINCEVLDFNIYGIYKEYFKEEDMYFGYISYLNDSNNYRLHEKILGSKIKAINIDQVRYLSEDDYEPYLALRAIDKQVLIKTLDNVKYKRHTPHTIEQFFVDDYKDFLSKIELDLTVKDGVLPKYKFCKDGYNYQTFLSALVNAGLKKRLKSNVTSEYIKRVNYELSVINELNYSDYFLIVWDIIKFCKQSNIIVGPGRGSSAGSLVAYCLGITQVDPIKYGLIFERFLNPMRVSNPDIDIDFADDKREEVVQYIIERFVHAGKICTFSKFLAKSAFRDVSKIYGLDNSYINLISKELTSSSSMKDNIKANKNLQKEYIKNNQFSSICDVISLIEGLPRQTSVHAAGIIISEDSLFNYASVDKENVIQHESKDLEAKGLLKFDILSLSNLSFIGKVINSIKESMSIDIDITNIPLDDKLTFDLLSKANTKGIFQMESDGIKSLLVKSKPKTISDIANVLALYRPGPMKYIDQYIKNKESNNTFNSLLSDSYGIMIYQEQVMKISSEVGGFSLGQADLLRRAISKKDYISMSELKERFIVGAVKKGYSKSNAINQFNDIESFAGYGFNKAHAYSYALIVYQMSFLKAHYPDNFITELFQSNISTTRRDVFLEELRLSGVKIYGPNIMKSALKMRTSKKNILLGLQNINGIDINMCNDIIKNREGLKNLNFIESLIHIFKGIVLTDKQIKNISYSGALDVFGYSQDTIYYYFKHVATKKNLSTTDFAIEERSQSSDDFLSKYELDAININIKHNLFKIRLNSYVQASRENILILDQLNLYKLKEEHLNNVYKIYVKILSIDKIKTKKGADMSFITVQSESVYQVVVFTTQHNKYIEKIEKNIGEYVPIYITTQNENFYLQKI